MTKSEIVSRIIDRITDPWSENPEDYLYANPINLISAKEWLHTWREEDKLCELDPDECMPKEATPELLMEAYNCYIRYQRHELFVDRLIDWINETDPVCEYINYYAPTIDRPVGIVPVDFLEDMDVFPFPVHGTDKPDILKLILIGQVSRNTFNPGDEYCWFDEEKEILHSTNHPFLDGILDADAFARFLLNTSDVFEYIIDSYFYDDDIKNVFGCTKDELMKEVNG